MIMITLTLIALYLAGVYFFTRLIYRMTDKDSRRQAPILYEVSPVRSEEKVIVEIREDKKLALLAGSMWPVGLPAAFLMTRDYSRWPDLLGWIK